MIIRYFSIFIRAITILLFPYIYGENGLFSLTIIGYLYTFLIVPVELYSQYSVYNELSSRSLKNIVYINNFCWLISIFTLSFLTKILFNNDQFIFNQLDTLLIFSCAFLLKENSKGYYRARNIEMYKYANYMNYLITPVFFFIIQLVLFLLNLEKGHIYSISTFLSFLIPYLIIKSNKKLNIKLNLKKKNSIKFNPKNKKIIFNKRIIFSTIIIYLLPALFYIIGGKFFGNDYQQIFIALFITQKIVDFITPSLDFFENVYPYKIKKISLKNFHLMKLFIKKIFNFQIKLNLLLLSILIILSAFIFALSSTLPILKSDITIYTILFTSIMLIINCYQGHDLIISRFNPNYLIKIDFLLSLFACIFLIISLYYSLPALIIITPLITIFLRRVLSANALKANIV